jgi:hypothetical protein
MRTRIRLVAPLAALAAAATLGACRNPEADAEVAAAMIQLNDQLNDVLAQLGDQAASLDSLRGVVARQDTVIRQLANITGVPLPPPRPFE